MKRCSKRDSRVRKDGTTWQCPKLFPASDTHNLCPDCRKMSAASTRRSPAFKVYMKEYTKSEAGKASQKRSNQSDKGKLRQKRYAQTEKGKQRNKRSNDQISARLASSLYKMVRGTHNQPVTFVKLGIFASNADAKAHFVSTFDPWMSMVNLGAYRKGDEYDTKWNLGHKIPQVWYDADDEAELRKCWSRANLFAQCARKNVESVDTALLTESQWLALKEVWPKQCVSMSDAEAWMWAVTNRAKVERVRRGK